ncbi:hypothetical protein GGR51DRAFT_527692 [Nemania sp. FL0031]|nr:hypothetical protein GGR51DRAFT_527692 [Nemania sp. FL0031]
MGNILCTHMLLYSHLQLLTPLLLPLGSLFLPATATPCCMASPCDSSRQVGWRDRMCCVRGRHEVGSYVGRQLERHARARREGDGGSLEVFPLPSSPATYKTATTRECGVEMLLVSETVNHRSLLLTGSYHTHTNLCLLGGRCYYSGMAMRLGRFTSTCLWNA